MSLRRGDVVLVRARHGEPYQAVGRPALVVQSGEIDADAYDSVVVCLITGSSTRGGICRVEIAASSTAGLKRPSEILVEKIAAIPLAQVGPSIGKADTGTLQQVDRALVLLLDLP
ncbi:MAG: type II toxin-antitoxin system PemK/MazF family toxin [Geminicoccaceae bacterium]